MASKYDWEFIKPLDQTANIAAMTYGNQQMLAGLQGMGTAVTGLADHYKQRNTDDILNTLMQAQTSQDLPNAMNAVQALQQQYGRGYDQTKVRDAIDTRGQVLGQRDLQSINLQQAQATQAALPQLNQFAIEQARQMGIDTSQMEGLANLGIDATGQLNQFTNNMVSFNRDSRDYRDRRNDRTEDLQIAKESRDQAQENWKYDRDFREDESNWKRADDISKENPKENTLSFNGEKWVTTVNPGISRMDAYGALSGTVGKIIGAESAGVADAKNPRSTATGAGQFIDSTWVDILSRNRPDLVKGKSRQQILEMRKDPKLSGQMTEAYANENADGLRKAGLPVTEGTIYLSHFAGPGGARSLLRANPNASAESVLGSKAANDNPSIIKGKSVADVINWAENKMGGQGSTSTAAAASNAIQIPQATATKVVNNYSAAITELQNKFNLQTSQDQAKTALGSKGQTIDSWLTSKTTKDREGSTLLTDYSNKVAKLGRNNAKLSNLPMDDQLQILDAAHAWSLTSGGVITDKELNKQISSLATRVINGKKNELEQGKKNIFETQYQAFVQEMNAAGMPAVDRNAFRQLVSPETVPKSSKSTPKPSLASEASRAVVTSGSVDNPFYSEPTPKPAPAAAPKSPLSLQPRSGGQAFVPYANAGGPKPVPVPPKAPAAAPVLTKAQQNAQAREARKEIQRAAASKRYTESKQPKPKPVEEARSAIDKLTGGAKPLINNSRTLSAKELEEFMRKYKVQ